MNLLKTNKDLNSVQSYLGPSMCNKLPEKIKQSTLPNTVKHMVQKKVLQQFPIQLITF